MPYTIEDIYQTDHTFDGANNMAELGQSPQNLVYHEAALGIYELNDEHEPQQLATTFILLDDHLSPTEELWFKATLPYEMSYHRFATQLVEKVKMYGCRLELQDLLVDIDRDSIEVGLVKISEAPDAQADEMEFDIVFKIHPNAFAQYINENVDISFEVNHG